MVSDMVMIVFHDMHDNDKLEVESCYSHENKQFRDFSMTFWESFTFQDFSMNFHDSNFFQDFPGFSMTVGTLMIVADTILAPINEQLDHYFCLYSFHLCLQPIADFVMCIIVLQ